MAKKKEKENIKVYVFLTLAALCVGLVGGLVIRVKPDIDLRQQWLSDMVLTKDSVITFDGTVSKGAWYNCWEHGGLEVSVTNYCNKCEPYGDGRLKWCPGHEMTMDEVEDRLEKLESDCKIVDDTITITPLPADYWATRKATTTCDSGYNLQTSEYQIEGNDLEHIAWCILTRHIDFERLYHTNDWQICCPKCSGAMVCRDSDYNDEVVIRNASITVEQIYCQCGYPIGTDWKVVDLSK